MGKDEVSVKKRRKPTAGSVATSERAKPVIDYYQAAVDFEEAEALHRSAEEDANLFRKICQDVRNLFSQIAELKSLNTEEAKSSISEKRIEASLLLVSLKKLNRLEKVRARAGRDAMHKEKQRVDSTHLLLQNLLYEVDHLHREVNKCLQFQSKDEDIDLIPVEQFYQEAPDDVSRPNVTKSDEHELRLARLEWELRQRRELATRCGELAAGKARAAAAAAAARSRLSALKPHLAGALLATKPVQECLAMSMDARRELSRRAASLPQPLYLLFANCSAYAEAFSSHNVSVLISGDEEEAKRLKLSTAMSTSITADDSNDSDSDLDNGDGEQEKKKRHHRGAKVTREEKAEEKKKQILKKHPLTVQLTIKFNDSTALNLAFSFLITLNIVTVKSTVTVAEPILGVSAAEVLNGPNILYTLYAGDTGSDSPDPKTSLVLKSADISGDFSQFISELGRPYIWAQRMCGLDFMAVCSTEALASSANLSIATVENVIVNLRRRLKARIGLMKELQDLESGKIVPMEGAGPFPVRILGSMTQWQSITWAEYRQASSTSKLIEDEIVNQDDLLYRAIITRQSAKLVAMVALKNEYPKKPPIFSLTLHWNGTHFWSNSDDIRDIERCVNTDWGDTDKTVKFSLSVQLTKLLVCLDILMEAQGCSEFPPEKVMFRPVRGRNRAKPFKFLKEGTGIFTQYFI